MLQNKNSLKVKVDRFKTTVRFKDLEYHFFDFNNNLKSDHISEYQFTNYTSSDKCKKYMKLRDICKLISEDNKQIDNIFVPTETDINTDIPKMNRIYNIINTVNGRDVDRKEAIIKCMCIEDNEIQFYLRKEENVLKLYLIDLYHIGIEATNKKTGRNDRVGIYKAHQKCSFDIKEIQNELHNTSDKP